MRLASEIRIKVSGRISLVLNQFRILSFVMLRANNLSKPSRLIIVVVFHTLQKKAKPYFIWMRK